MPNHQTVATVHDHIAFPPLLGRKVSETLKITTNKKTVIGILNLSMEERSY